MAEDPKKLADAQRIANEAMESGNEIQRNFGALLNKNIQTAGKLNNVIKNRLGTMSAINDSLKDQSKSILDSTKLENQLNSINQKLANSRKKNGQFQKGNNNLTIAALKTDREGVKAAMERVETMNQLNDITGGLVEKAEDFVKAISVGAIFAGLVSIAKKFGESIDKIGEAFGSLPVMGKEFQQDLLRSSVEATKLGGGLDDVASITNALASDFGMGVEEAAQLSSKVFDTSKAIGLSAEEGANLFGVLTQTANLSAEQAESLAEGTFQLARQAGVAPNAVLKDLAGSAEEIALFTEDGGDNIAEAAVQARRLGLSLSTTAKIAEGLLDFESSIANEVEASVLIGRQLNFQKARELALNNDIAGATKAVVDQLGSEAEFNKLNVIQRKALADSIGVSVGEMSKLVGQSDKLSLSGALAGNNFEDLLGQEGISNISQLTNQFAALGATLVNSVGPVLSVVVSGLNMMLSPLVKVVEGLEKMNALGPVLTGVLSGLAAAYATVKVQAMGAALATAKQTLGAGASIGKIVMKAIATFFGAAAEGSTATLGFGTPVMVGLAVAAVATMMAAMAKAKSVNDFKSGPGGINFMSGPAGAFSLNPRDSVLATTNPIPVNDVISTPAGGINVGGGNMNLSINLKAKADALEGVLDNQNAGGQPTAGGVIRPRFG